MSTYVDLPDQVLIDYQHACCEGTGQQLVLLWTNPDLKFKHVLRRATLLKLDEILLKIKYPREISRRQRSLFFLSYFKSNEFRSLLFYALIYAFNDILPAAHYEHFLLYVAFIRLLTQKKLNPIDIENAQHLIDKFSELFYDLYGLRYMTYNLHVHRHLPSQCEKFGPLHLNSCFPFEGRI